MKKFFHALSVLFLTAAKKCQQWSDSIAKRESRKQALLFDEYTFIKQIEDPVDREFAGRVFRSCRDFGLSCMDLAIAFGWMRSRGQSARDALVTLSGYMERHPKQEAHELILRHIIIRPGMLWTGDPNLEMGAHI
jgi:hypothetical protein